MTTELPSLHAVIGVWHRGNRTYYVRRSEKMANYPLVWSLLSIQFDPHWLTDTTDRDKVQQLMDQMSEERLGGTPIAIRDFLISGDSVDNPDGKHVHLWLYEVELTEERRLNPEYYVDSAWMTPKEYEAASAGQRCGLCLNLWSDYAWLAGITDRPFVSRNLESHV